MSFESLLVRSSSSAFSTAYEGLFTVDPFLVNSVTTASLDNIIQGNTNRSSVYNAGGDGGGGGGGGLASLSSTSVLPVGNLLHPDQSKFPLEYGNVHYFEKYFLNKDHYSFVGVNKDFGTFALSVIKEKTLGKTFYRTLLWTKKGIHHSYFLRPLQATSQLSAVTTQITKELQVDKTALNNIQPVPKQFHSDFWQELLKLEQMFIPDKACIGVVDGTFAHGAVDLDAMITSALTSTSTVTNIFDKLGDRIRILDGLGSLAKFGGLLGVADANPDASAYVTRIHGCDIVFHVSSLLPVDDGKGGHQVARKRLIGNDVGVIVILSEGAIFDPNAASSKVNHVFLVIQLAGVNKDGHFMFRVATTSKTGLPAYGPNLVDQDNMMSWTDFRAFILTKLLNGMNAATQHAPGFKREDVYLQLLEDLHVRFTERARTESVFRDLMNAEPPEDAAYDFDMYNSNLDLSSAGVGGSSSSSGSGTPPSRSDPHEKSFRKSFSISKIDRHASMSKNDEETKALRKSFSADKVRPKSEYKQPSGDASSATSPPKSPSSVVTAVSFALEANETINNADDDDEELKFPSMLAELGEAEGDDVRDAREVSFATGFDALSYDATDYDAPENALGDLNRKLGDLDEEQKAYILSMVDLESNVRANELLDEDYGDMWTKLEHTTYVDLPASTDGHGYSFVAEYDCIVVTNVIPGSVADRSGLCKEDRILTVNGVKIHENNIGTVVSMLEDHENPFDLLICRAITIDGADQAIQDANPAAALLKAWLNDKKDSICLEEPVPGKNILFEVAVPLGPPQPRSRSGSVAGALFKSTPVQPIASSLSGTSSSSPVLGNPSSSLSAPGSPSIGESVLGGSINALIHHLVVANDSAFMEVFMVTYSSFTTNEILLKKLIQKYYEPQTALDSSSRSNFLVCNVLKKLITDHWDDMTGRELLILREFLVQATIKKGNASKAEKGVMNLLIETVKNVERPKMLAPDMYESDSVSSVLDFSAKDVARQITLRDSIVFRRIRVSELLGSAWSREDRNMTCPNLMMLIKQFNEVSHWCSASILAQPSATDRAEMITKFIKVLKELFALNNFSSMIAIIAGLNSAGVCRLKRSFALVPKRTMSVLVDLTTLMSSKGSHHKYRMYLAKVKSACVPYMGLYLQDLTFIEDGNPNKLPGTSLINFSKRKMVHEVVEKIRNIQASCQYKSLKPNPKILSCITGFKRMSEDEMYKLSLVLEPKQGKTQVQSSSD